MHEQMDRMKTARSPWATGAFGVSILVAGALGTAAIPAVAAVATGAVEMQAASGDPRRLPSGRFTPAKGDPRLAASFARRNGDDLSFTPAGSRGDEKKRVRVAVRSADAQGGSANRRVAEAAATPRRTTLTPSDYDLGVDVGWKRFKLSTDIAETSDSTGPAIIERDRARVGLSYGSKVSGQVALSADRESARVLPSSRGTDSYALDVGGAVKITNNIAITGGVRYRIDQERLNVPDVDGQRLDSQAVYVGTKLRF